MFVSAVAVAVWLARDQLTQIRGPALLAALRATPVSAIALSVLFTALSYGCLALVEWQALKVIGRPQPPWRTATASLASNAISIVIGFGVLSGAAVRLRTYAFAKLKSGEIARLVILMQAATFIAGLVTEGLGLLPALPGPVSSSMGWARPAAAIVLVAPAALWFILFRSSSIKGVKPLNMAERMLALLAGLGDWGFSGAALFVLSPHDPAAFISFLTIFCLASLMGAAVGAPGGIGILEAVVLGSQARSNTHETAAALILYRMIYFIAPALLTLIAGAAAHGGKLMSRLASRRAS